MSAATCISFGAGESRVPGPLIDTCRVPEPDSLDPPPPVWRVPVHPLPPELAKRSAQVLAMTEVETPRGQRYRVQIRPEPPEHRHPLPAVADAAGLVLPALLGGALSAAARKLKLTVVQPGDRWLIEVVRRATTWRNEKVVYDEIIGAPDALIDRAFELADLIQRGASRLTWGASSHV